MQNTQNMRAVERIRSFLRAQIIFNNRMSTIDCVIKNISPNGAKIALADTVTVPKEFDLSIPQRGRSYHARLIWRDTEFIGVEFTDAQDAASVRTAPAAETAKGGEARLHELEIQNAELKARVRALCKKLEDLGQDPGLV
ncbi:MAG TPA: PilZ domain-containing protein [Methylovirgula sp.]|nr:PilZ domain-containing protein [Methylovirgula sp.]